MKRITVDRQTDARGFRERVVADVEQETESGGERFYIARVVSVFAYHPAHPERGRDLPNRGALIAYTENEITAQEELP